MQSCMITVCTRPKQAHKDICSLRMQSDLNRSQTRVINYEPPKMGFKLSTAVRLRAALAVATKEKG